MNVSIIVAFDQERGIGRDGRLPWHLAADMKRFRNLTMGHMLIVGRKTYESIGGNLAGRVMIILTKQDNYHAPGCEIANSIQQALDIAASHGESEVFVIGGSDIYQIALPFTSRIYLTRVHTTTNSDTFFPEIDPSDWEEDVQEFIHADEKNDHAHTFSVLKRLGSAKNLNLP